MIIEGVIPIVVDPGNLEMVNSMNADLDNENLVDNIENSTINGDLSPE